MTENNLEVQGSKVQRLNPAAGNEAANQIKKETLDCDF